MTVRILQGDVRAMLATMEPESVQAVVTSPPYFNLRDYGTASWDGGSAECDHHDSTPSRRANAKLSSTLEGSKENNHRALVSGRTCGRCGAQRIDKQIGLESTPAEFIATLVAVFEDVKRVLRPDGVCFVNIGDSYAGSGKGPSGANGIGDQEQRQGFVNAPKQGGQATGRAHDGLQGGTSLRGFEGIKPKSLLLIPQRFAIAMQDAGWYVRSQIAWCKTSAMPESVRDRPTSAWEPIWMFTKQARYFWDQDAVREKHSAATTDTAQRRRMIAAGKFSTEDEFASRATGQRGGVGERMFRLNEAGANLRNFWLLGPEPSREEHYAAFPSEIPRRCILAATSEKGQCPACGSPWTRTTESSYRKHRPSGGQASRIERGNKVHDGGFGGWGTFGTNLRKDVVTTGWTPSCQCPPADPVPQLVLDPFLGSGTTALVADQLGRNAIGIELSPTYVEMARRRITNDAPMFADVTVAG